MARLVSSAVVSSNASQKRLARGTLLRSVAKSSALKEGTEVQFKYETAGQKNILVGLKVAGQGKNSDGLSYEEKNFGSDGTHQSPSGQEKVGKQLLKFFRSDSTTKTWFLGK